MNNNEFGEINEEEDVKESEIDYSNRSFIVKLPNGGYINIDPEFVPDGSATITSGRFHVLYVHPQYGTSTFYVELVDGFEWHCENHPPFVNDNFIYWVGQQIDNYNR